MKDYLEYTVTTGDAARYLGFDDPRQVVARINAGELEATKLADGRGVWRIKPASLTLLARRLNGLAVDDYGTWAGARDVALRVEQRTRAPAESLASIAENLSQPVGVRVAAALHLQANILAPPTDAEPPEMTEDEISAALDDLTGINLKFDPTVFEVRPHSEIPMRSPEEAAAYAALLDEE